MIILAPTSISEASHWLVRLRNDEICLLPYIVSNSAFPDDTLQDPYCLLRRFCFVLSAHLSGRSLT